MALVTLPGAASAVASGVYATNAASVVTQFNMSPGGELSLARNASSGSSPIGIAVSPDGKSVYVANAGSNTISQYDAGVGGALSAKATPSVSTGGYPFDVAISPDGHSVYVTNADGGSVSQFEAGPDGALAPMTPTIVPVGEKPEGIAVSTDGRNVYVANAGSNSLSQFDVGPRGALSPKTTPTIATGGFPTGIALSPDGRSVYVTNLDTRTVSQYDVGVGGALAPKSPATVAAGYGPLGIAVSPSGRNVYVANNGNGVRQWDVSQYNVGPNGALTPKATPTIETGFEPWGVAVSPDGKNVYVASSRKQTEQGVSQYNVSPDGSLSPKSPDRVGRNVVRSIVVAPDQAPVASFTVNSSGAGSPSSFDASASAAMGGRSVVRYDWAFGDGSHKETTGPRVTHTYDSPNTFTVTLTVTDDAGCSTRTVFTGHTVYCYGTSEARTTRHVSVLGRGHGLAKVGRARTSGDLALIPVSCVGRAACKLTLSITAIEKLKNGKIIGVTPARAAGGLSTRRVTLGRREVTLKPGEHETVRLPLDRPGDRLLQRFHRFTATLRAPRALTAIDNQQLTFH